MSELAVLPGTDSLIISGGTDIAAADLRAIVAWVTSKRGSEHTRRAFRIEAQRWLAWLIWAKSGQMHTTWLDKAQSLDAAAYAEFLTLPKTTPIPTHILRMAGLERQPFKSDPLAAPSVERAVSALKTMYADLVEMVVDDGLQITRNPFARFKVSNIVSKKSPRQKALNEAERGYVEAALEAMQRAGDPHYHQCRWIWKALRWSALRRHELAKARAGDIYQDTDERGEAVWVLQVTGKGGTTKTIPLVSEFMKEFAFYRAHHGLPAIPVYEGGRPEDTPLVLPIRGAMRQVSDSMVYRAIKKLMKLAAEEATACNNPAAAGRLESFASHSARHTCITTIVDATGDITLGQDIARHASITTTRGYKAKSVSRLKDEMEKLAGKK